MEIERERDVLVVVQERLRQRFPEADATVVEAAVRLSYAALAGPVRNFVPLLVERAAHELLSTIHGRTAGLPPIRQPA